MADEAFGVVEIGFLAAGKGPAESLTFLGVSLAGAGGVLTVANTTRTAYTAVSGLVGAVKAFV